MKKLLFTFSALTLSITLSLAQTTNDAAHDNESQKLEIERLSNTPESLSKKKINMDEVPLEVQEALLKADYQDWEVTEIYEIQQESDIRLDDDDPRVDEPQYEYGYEILLMNEELTEESESSKLKAESSKTENPALLLHYDEEGNLLQEQPVSPEESQEDENY